MPFSNSTSIPTVLYFTEKVRPMRILDVGVGIGVYGLLVRTVLDIAHERISPRLWRLQIDGLEVFESYRNPVWDYVYDRVEIGDARTHPLPKDSYDLVIIADVLEHMTAPEGLRCLEKLLVAAPTVIVTTPIGHIPQGAWGGNPFETHRSVANPAHFPSLVCDKITGLTRCCVCCRDSGLAEALRWDAATAPVSRPELMPYVVYRIRRKMRSLLRRLRLDRWSRAF